MFERVCEPVRLIRRNMRSSEAYCRYLDIGARWDPLRSFVAGRGRFPALRDAISKCLSASRYASSSSYNIAAFVYRAESS